MRVQGRAGDRPWARLRQAPSRAPEPPASGVGILCDRLVQLSGCGFLLGCGWSSGAPRLGQALRSWPCAAAWEL